MFALLWFGAILIVAVAGTLLVLQQRGVILTGNNHKELPSLERNLFNLQIGDIIQYMGRDWVVEGKLTYNVGGYIWFEYLLQDNNDIRWLSVDEDDRVEVAFLEPTNQLEISQTPPKQLTFADEIYRCVDSGMAKMTRVGTTLRKTAERCEYFDYKGNGDNVLSIEIWDGEVEVTIGYQINPRSLTLLPGDGKRVYGV